MAFQRPARVVLVQHVRVDGKRHAGFYTEACEKFPKLAGVIGARSTRWPEQLGEHVAHRSRIMISMLDLLVGGWPFTMSAVLVCAAIGYRLGGPGPAMVCAIVFGAAGFWADYRMGKSLPHG